MFEFYSIVAAAMVFDVVVLAILVWAFASPRFAAQRISQAPTMKVSRSARLENIAVSSTLSLLTVVGGTYALFDVLFHQRETPLWLIALQGVGILVVYDFLYYFMHRGMHNKKVMRFVHGVHHRARNPSSLESFYLHPAELFAGLALLMLCTFIVGPVHIYSFGAAFFIYSPLNIVIHCGLRFKNPLLAPITFLTKKHHVHHMDDFGRNYASLTPLPDLVFRTYG